MKTWIDKNWIDKNWKLLASRRAITALALALAVLLGSYEILKPAPASAASEAAPAPALDASSVNALLTLDRAMQTLAAHVPPATVNVTVAARHKTQVLGHWRGETQHQDQEQDQVPGDIQRFFGPFGFGRQMRPGP